MPAPIGNRNAAKAKEFEGAIRKAIAQRSDPDTLRKIADKVLDMALDGNLFATGMIADRLDGKPTQSTELTGKNGESLFRDLSSDEIRAEILKRLASPEIKRALGEPLEKLKLVGK